MENHYKDGTWHYPEFAQPEDIFLEVLDRIDSPYFGVQYDPSNAIVGGYDPIRFLEKVLARVVTMHASDRSLAPGATLNDLRQSDGALGYSEKLRHGEVGRGLIDYDTIFAILARGGLACVGLLECKRTPCPLCSRTGGDRSQARDIANWRSRRR